ncbi:expressed unknown protein [Seminavis robusta]|uniref:Uncharacterized protein n=1 Tax=Seminavis robusta TaxID=568900 RepID=A0A9N8ESY2_9STRA|nr:expressed unknown protein [Seminavis robusta]|eukprot:Sro1500_g277830.1 n/a (345) ;mRNA; f:12238-13272
MDERREWQQKLDKAGIDPRGLDGKEDIDEACELLSIDGLGPKTRFRAFLKDLGEVCFNVTAEIEDGRLSKGVRAAVYMKADDNTAHFIPGENPIRYGEGDDINKLSVSLYFNTYEAAMGFSRALRKWSFDHPNSSVQPKVSLAVSCIRPINLQPVTFDQYDPAEAEDSPCTSLADFRGFSLVLATEPAELDSPLKTYQAIERAAWLSSVGAYKLHLKDKALPEFKKLRYDDNNLLAASWTFHQFFDGLNLPDTPHRVPQVAVKPLRPATERHIFNDGERRLRIDVQVECFTQKAANTLRPYIPDGGTTVAIYAQNADILWECLQWKYDDSIAKWGAYQAELNQY